MHPDVLLLMERFVLATERISQDVNNISAYIFDLSYNVSHFLNQKRDKEGISVVPCDEDDYLPSGTNAAQQEASESECSLQDKQPGESSESHIDNMGHEKPSMSTEGNETNVLLSPEGNSIPTEGMKNEEQSECGEDGDSCDMHYTYDSGRNSVWISRKIESFIQPEGEEETLSYNELSAVNKPHEESSDGSTHVARHPGAGSSVPRTHTESSLRSNDGGKLFQCTLCGKTCSTNGNLMIHMRVHSEERPHKCWVCEKSFKFSSHLQRHMRLHSGEKPFTCRLCGKAFSESCGLKIHTRVHTGERPFPCKTCGCYFTTSGSLQRHRRRKHGVAFPVSQGRG